MSSWGVLLLRGSDSDAVFGGKCGSNGVPTTDAWWGGRDFGVASIVVTTIATPSLSVVGTTDKFGTENLTPRSISRRLTPVIATACVKHKRRTSHFLGIVRRTVAVVKVVKVCQPKQRMTTVTFESPRAACSPQPAKLQLRKLEIMASRTKNQTRSKWRKAARALFLAACAIAPGTAFAQRPAEYSRSAADKKLERPSEVVLMKESSLIEEVIEPELIFHLDPLRSKIIRTRMIFDRNG
ncbi:MAG TPA: hypothetical protein PLV92_24180, partial [Pirellulaceae bacterium]|nr:hypothetical protein [Pirellulaceae bacterium]